MRNKSTFFLFVIILLTSLAASPGDLGGNNPDAFAADRDGERPIVRSAEQVDVSEPLGAVEPIPPIVEGPSNPKPRKWLPNREGSSGPTGLDPVLQDPSDGPAIPSPLVNFEGINNVNGVLPPDTVGDIGPNHYVQMVNLSFAIYSRTGALLYGPANTNTLWSGFGGPCQTTNDGDPIVLYDEMADRWIMTQFALPNFPSGPFYECIAVSQTGDPLGAWHRYAFLISNTKLDDYPKFGVWPDGYYMAINQFTCNLITCSWGGQGVVVFERDAMLNGDPALMVYFDLFNQDPDLGAMLPSDLDGPQPPSGAPNIFSQVDDNAIGFPTDQLQLWEFSVNWGNPSSSTFTHMVDLPTAAFDSNLCGFSRNCIPQPGRAKKVDAISDRLMYRLQYRNFGTHQTLVTNHTVDVNGSDRAGIRWYELRNSGGGWSIFQQGTYSPDTNHRWMGSIAMNSAGDISLGYSISSSSVFPSIRYTGRLDGDPAGQMTQGEGTIINGSGSQTHSSGRWGDYSMMSVDPTDDCTFWYTQEYYAVTGSAPWQTRVGSFKIRDCNGGGGNNPPTVNIANPAEGSTVSGTVTVQIGAADVDGTISSAEWSIDGGSFQPATFNSGTGFYEAGWDTTTLSDGAHIVNARATDNLGAQGNDSNNVTVSNGGGATSLHVGDLDGTKTSQSGRWTAFVTITVHDSNHAPVANALVSGAWSNGASGSASCTTNGSGVCTVSKNNIRNNFNSVTFTVNNVTHATLSYNAADNHDPDGDSNGTVIVVNKP